MKKSQTIFLSSLFFAAAVSCEQKPKDEWLTSQERQDTVINKHQYRYYGGFWYPLFMGRFNPGLYQGYSYSDFHNSPSSIRPVKRSSVARSGSSGVRSGGFGSSSHYSSRS